MIRSPSIAAVAGIGFVAVAAPRRPAGAGVGPGARGGDPDDGRSPPGLAGLDGRWSRRCSGTRFRAPRWRWPGTAPWSWRGVTAGPIGMPGSMLGPTTLFALASVSKSLTAVTVLKLVEGGRLDLDARVFELLTRHRPLDGDRPTRGSARSRSATCSTTRGLGQEQERRSEQLLGASGRADAGAPADRAQTTGPLHARPAAGLRPRDAVQVLEFRLHPAGADHRASRRGSPTTRPCSSSRSGRWGWRGSGSTGCGEAATCRRRRIATCRRAARSVKAGTCRSRWPREGGWRPPRRWSGS